MPKGIILSLDFQNIENGLIPNKTLYSLHVPVESMSINTVNNRKMLVFKKGEGLDIPHSSLLDPDGSLWIASVRMIAQNDGIIMSQSNDKSGYVIYLKDGMVHATILTAQSVVILKGGAESGFGNVFGKRISINLKIGQDSASLFLNRIQVAHAPIQRSLAGKNLRIRIGEHATVPTPLKHDPTSTPNGFSGGISSFKILRQ